MGFTKKVKELFYTQINYLSIGFIILYTPRNLPDSLTNLIANFTNELTWKTVFYTFATYGFLPLFDLATSLAHQDVVLLRRNYNKIKPDYVVLNLTEGQNLNSFFPDQI